MRYVLVQAIYAGSIVRLYTSFRYRRYTRPLWCSSAMKRPAALKCIMRLQNGCVTCVAPHADPPPTPLAPPTHKLVRR